MREWRVREWRVVLRRERGVRSSVSPTELGAQRALRQLFGHRLGHWRKDLGPVRSKQKLITFLLVFIFLKKPAKSMSTLETWTLCTRYSGRYLVYWASTKLSGSFSKVQPKARARCDEHELPDERGERG